MATTAEQLDATFAALADPTRRAILARLARGEASVNELAAPFAMSQPAISKHLKVLEKAGLIARGRDAQRRPCRIVAKPLGDADAWLQAYREFWKAASNASTTCSSSSNREATDEERKASMKNTGTLKVEVRGDREIVMTRVFDAPRDLVWKAMTQPELMKRWFGPHGHQLIECEIDLRPGGKWRYVLLQPDGSTMGMFGEYLEVEAPERTVHTESFDQFAEFGAGVITTVLAEENGKTTLTAVEVAAVGRGARRDRRDGHGARSGRDLRQARRAAHDPLITLARTSRVSGPWSA